MLKVLVDNGFQLADPCPSTLFCLLEFEGARLTTSHVPVQAGRVRFNEEAEFNIKKGGSLRIQLCSIDSKPGLLSLEEHKLFGRAKHVVNYDSPKQSVQVLHELELKSKSGKPRAKMKLTITIPGNPNAVQDTKNLDVPKSPKTSSNPFKRATSPFRNRNGRGGSFRSTRSSGAGSRNSLDSAGYETNQSSILFEEVSPDFNARARRGRPQNDGMMFDNTSKFNPSQSLTSIDDIQEHEPDNRPIVKKREKKADKKPVGKSVRNTIIGGIGFSNNNKERGFLSSTNPPSPRNNDNSQMERLELVNRELKEAVKTRDKEIKELNKYIESLLVKVMAKSPDLLQS